MVIGRCTAGAKGRRGLASLALLLQNVVQHGLVCPKERALPEQVDRVSLRLCFRSSTKSASMVAAR